jgi:hypothetical protein
MSPAAKTPSKRGHHALVVDPQRAPAVTPRSAAEHLAIFASKPSAPLMTDRPPRGTRCLIRFGAQGGRWRRDDRGVSCADARDLILPSNASGGQPELDAFSSSALANFALRAGYIGAVAAVEVLTDFRSSRCTAVRTQSIAVSPPPMTTTFLPLSVEIAFIERVARHRRSPCGSMWSDNRVLTAGTDTRHLDRARFVHAGCDQNRVMAAQLSSVASRPTSGTRRKI